MDQGVLLGNYNGFAPQMQTVYEGILEKVSPGTQVQLSRGCDIASTSTPNTGELDGLASYGPPVDAVIAVLGYNSYLEGEEGGTAEGGDGDRHHYGLRVGNRSISKHSANLASRSFSSSWPAARWI